jgi:PKD repeat protein
MKKKVFGILALAICIFHFPMFGALSGNYTIGSGPATATNYVTFASAVSDMNAGTRADGGPVNGPGVSAAVIFTVAANTYNEKISIPAITGASATNTITFEGVDPLTRILTWTGSLTNDYTLQLNGADFVRIRNLGINNPGVTYGHGIYLIGGANNNIIDGCRISLPTTTTSTSKVGICAATAYSTVGVFTANLVMQNNTLIGGYVGIAANGNSATLSPGLVMDNNIITDAYYTGFYVSYLSQPQLTRNMITMRSGYASGYGLQVRYCATFDLSRNKVTNSGTYGFYVLNGNYNTTAPSTISNNMIGGGFQSTGTAYGLYLSTNRYINVYHNSVLVDHAGTAAYGLYLTGTSLNMDIRNNALAVTTTSATSYAIYVSSASYLTWCDYNRYHSAGTNLAYFQGAYANLATLQAAFVAYNQNCQSGWPNYVSNSNLHTFGPALNNWALNLPSVTNDFDNDPRPIPPDPTKDVGADELSVPPIDPDIWALTAPIVPIVGANTVAVQIQNNGTSSLNGIPITLQYSTNGGTTWPVTEVFTPSSLAAPLSQQTFSFATPWVISTSGTYTYCVRINPAVVGDPDASDQMCKTVCTGMAGTYTINGGLPTGGTNFNNFTDCATALGGCGVGGAVTINIVPGTYTETFTINTISGVSASNTVTFNGGDTSLVTLQYNHTLANASVVTLDNADYVKFKRMKVVSTGPTYGSCFKFTNAADHNTVDSCVMVLPTNGTSVYHIGILASGTTYSTVGNHANYLTVSNSRIRNGYYGVRINGVSSTVGSSSNKILKTSIRDFYYYGVYSYYQDALELSGNTIIGRTTGTFTTVSYGIYSYYSLGSFNFSGNTIHSVGNYGLYSGYGNYNNTGRGTIANNMIGGNFQSTGTPYAVYLLNNKDIDFVHNSIQLGTNIGYGVYISGAPPGADSLRFFNNIFSGGGSYLGQGGMAFYAPTTSINSVRAMDHNLFFTNGPALVNWGGSVFASLSAFQSAYPTLNVNSIEDDPGFIGATNLHVVCSPADGQGLSVGTLQDIDAQARSLSAPDIGADEFTGISVTTSLGPDLHHCGQYLLYADTVNFENFLWGGGQINVSLPIDTSGNYSVMAIDSNNCRAYDTIYIAIDSFPTVPFDGDTIALCAINALDAENSGSSFQWSFGDTTQIALPPTQGLHTVTITTQDGCSLTDSVTVNFFANANVELGQDTTFCSGGGALLDAGAGPTGTNYAWSTGATTQVLVISSPGMYFVTVTSPDGCTAEDSIHLNILLAPVVSLGPNFTACGPFTLDAGNPGSSYLWSTGATSQAINGTVAGTYGVTVTNANGCFAMDQTTVQVGTLPTVNLGPDQLLCNGMTANLNAGNPGSQFLWSTGALTQSITVTTPGTYIVQVTNANGCIGHDTVEVEVSTLTVNLGQNGSICDNGSVVLNAGNPNMAYLWSTGATTPTITVSQAGTYSVTVTDNLGCSAGDNIVLNQVPGVTAAISGPTTGSLFAPMAFTDASTGGAITWFWDFGDGLNASTQNPTHAFQALGTYTVTLIATNSNGCKDTTTHTILINNYVGADDQFFASAFELYPNPSDGVFHLYIELYKRSDVNINVLDVNGRSVYAERISKAQTYQGEIDLRDLSKGVYVLSIEAGEKKVFKKLVIQ